MGLINQKVLMSGVEFLAVEELNPYSDKSVQPDLEKARAEFAGIQAALRSAGVTIEQVPPPTGCQDGVYTANWGFVSGNKVILSSLPNMRQAEEPYARQVLEARGFEVITPPYRFSGQGDALPCGNLLLCGQTYRSDARMHQFLADHFDYEIVSLQTLPELDEAGQPYVNPVTGWPDSFFYDIDLTIAVLRPDLIAWCRDAFTPESQAKIEALNIDKIEVSYTEATEGFACNMVSTGETVIMSNHAPQLQAAIEAKGLKTITPEITELAKGGGYIRCTTLTLDNT